MSEPSLMKQKHFLRILIEKIMRDESGGTKLKK